MVDSLSPLTPGRGDTPVEKRKFPLGPQIQESLQKVQTARDAREVVLVDPPTTNLLDDEVVGTLIVRDPNGNPYKYAIVTDDGRHFVVPEEIWDQTDACFNYSINELIGNKFLVRVNPVPGFDINKDIRELPPHRQIGFRGHVAEFFGPGEW